MWTDAMIADLVAIQQVQNRYAVGIDQRRWDLLASCFTDHVVIDYPRLPRFTEAAEFVRWADEFHTPLGRTSHQMSSHTAEIDGDTAKACCCGHAVLTRFPDGTPDMHTYGRYFDTLTRTDLGWKIAERKLERVLIEPARTMTAASQALSPLL